MLTYPRNLEGSITILGEKGSVKIGGTAVNRVEHWPFAEYDDDDKLVEAANTNPPNVYGFGHEGYYRNVLAVLRGEAKPETDGRAGRKSLELILGIYESAKTGREVPIPLRNALTAELTPAARPGELSTARDPVELASPVQARSTLRLSDNASSSAGSARAARHDPR